MNGPNTPESTSLESQHPAAVEKCVRDEVDSILKKWRSRLAGRALEARGPTLEVRTEPVGSRTSEITVTFWRQQTFVDVLECMIYQTGRLQASAGEIAVWFDENIRDLLDGVDAP